MLVSVSVAVDLLVHFCCSFVAEASQYLLHFDSPEIQRILSYHVLSGNQYDVKSGWLRIRHAEFVSIIAICFGVLLLSISLSSVSISAHNL